MILDRMEFNNSSGQSTPKRKESNGLLKLETLSLINQDLFSPSSQHQQQQQTPTSSYQLHQHNHDHRNQIRSGGDDIEMNDNDYYSQQQHEVQVQQQQQVQQHNPGSFPPEIINLIIRHLYFIILPMVNDFPNPDPHLEILPPSHSSSSSHSSSTHPVFAPNPTEEARLTFTRLALVDTTWGAAATDFLWKSVGFGIPRAFESVLRTIEEYSTGRRISRAERLELAGSSGWSFDSIGLNNNSSNGNGMMGMTSLDDRGRRSDSIEDNKWNHSNSGSGGGNGSEGNSTFTLIHEPTLDSLRVSTALREVDSPLLRTKYISFARFRTAGLRRSLRQGSHERFVTPYRLLSLFRGTRLGDGPLVFPGAGEDEEDSIASNYGMEEDEDEVIRRLAKGKLESVGFTEFMDSAISKNVLDELLFRGGYLAEYEEPEEIVHMDIISDLDIPPSPMFNNFLTLPPLTPASRSRANSGGESFSARHLQSSSSRSPTRTHHPTLAPNFEEDSDEENEEGEERRRGRLDSMSRDRGGSGLNRRDSGAAYAPYQFESSRDRDESEERGRDRNGREVLPITPGRLGLPNVGISGTSGGGGGGGGGRGRGQQRRNRSQVPPSAFLTRSNSVPAQYLHRSTSFGTERSSSVPASIRRFRGVKKIVRVLEGSTEVKAIRALDLCGCVSSAFVAALEVMVRSYKLGPPGLFNSTVTSSSITAISESDNDSDDETFTESGISSYSMSSSHLRDDEKRTLRRIFFPHLRRLGLHSAVLPSPVLTAFVLSFPYLTHLDLTFTLASPQLLKNLAIAGLRGPGGREMRLKGLNLARCRLLTGSSIVGLMCGDCPPFTSMAPMGEEEEEESWGSGESVSTLIDLSLYGDATHPSPLSSSELRLVLTISPAFNSGQLRTLDLSSTPLTDLFLLEHFPPQLQLIELGLANCRGITLKGIATFLIEKAPCVEILDLSNSCPPQTPVISRRPTAIPSTTISIMELHTQLLSRVADVNPSSFDFNEAKERVQDRKTNLRVVELDGKALEAVQGGAGDWKPIWGKGRRGWYVDIGVISTKNPDRSMTSIHGQKPRILIPVKRDSSRRQALQRLSNLNGVVSGDLGWHSRKMEVLRGDGLCGGKEDGLYAFHSYQT